LISWNIEVAARMNSWKKRYIWSAVVVYLRALYYPRGFGFPLEEMSLFIYLIEVGREAATILCRGSHLA
jgi:hypothetical protein